MWFVADPCNSNPCQHGGTCLRANASHYECVCHHKFIGVDCQHCQYSSSLR